MKRQNFVARKQREQRRIPVGLASQRHRPGDAGDAGPGRHDYSVKRLNLTTVAKVPKHGRARIATTVPGAIPSCWLFGNRQVTGLHDISTACRLCEWQESRGHMRNETSDGLIVESQQFLPIGYAHGLCG